MYTKQSQGQASVGQMRPFLKINKYGIEEIVPWVKCLPHKHEDVCLLLRTYVEKSCIVMQTLGISTQDAGKKWIPAIYMPASRNLWAPGWTETLSQKLKEDGVWETTTLFVPWPPFTHIHGYTNVYTWTAVYKHTKKISNSTFKKKLPLVGSNSWLHCDAYLQIQILLSL